jgi:predicted DNA-binding transcriptional regulator YafY
MSDTLLRQWHMLQLIRRHPIKKDATEIKHRLADQGFEVTLRTIQRDLKTFSGEFPLVYDDRSKPFGWSWMVQGNVMDIPGMDSHTALAFYLADKHLEKMLPHETVAHLRPHFNQAKQVLDAIPTDSGAPAWRDKVRVLRRGQFLAPPAVQADVQEQVYEALLLNRKLKIEYHARNNDETKEQEVNPLGIVLKDAVIYLVCTYWDYTDIRLIVLHRVKEAEKLDIPSNSPDGFDLDDYIASGELDFAEGGQINLKANISKQVAFHLEERALSIDQKIEPLSEDISLLEATVNDTGELRWWLLGFGEQVEVLEPICLRKEFHDIVNAMASNYSNSSS